MGCDIHSRTEVFRNGMWYEIGYEPFSHRNYGLFGFLANVRNYSRSPVLSPPRGLPDAVKRGWDNRHSASWFTLDELLAVDYDIEFEDRRTTKQTGPNSWDGAALADVGEGELTTLREFLGEHYFKTLEALQELGDPKLTRVVFDFDS